MGVSYHDAKISMLIDCVGFCARVSPLIHLHTENISTSWFLSFGVVALSAEMADWL